MSGRPSTYTPEIADRICERMIEGEDIVEICLSEGMPHRSTFYRWRDADPEFRTRCARAREGLGDFVVHGILKRARAVTPETAAADRVAIAAEQWYAGKVWPKGYGDKMALVGGGEDDAPVQMETITSRDRAKAMAALLAKQSAKK